MFAVDFVSTLGWFKKSVHHVLLLIYSTYWDQSTPPPAATYHHKRGLPLIHRLPWSQIISAIIKATIHSDFTQSNYDKLWKISSSDSCQYVQNYTRRDPKPYRQGFLFLFGLISVQLGKKKNDFGGNLGASNAFVISLFFFYPFCLRNSKADTQTLWNHRRKKKMRATVLT